MGRTERSRDSEGWVGERIHEEPNGADADDDADASAGADDDDADAGAGADADDDNVVPV